MRKATLTRTETGDEGTFGTLVTDSGFVRVTGELPWRNNAIKSSCVPPGVYRCVWRRSPRFGYCYLLEGVPGRSNILIHAGNFAGDIAKGFQSDVEGCILLGEKLDYLAGQRAVVMSRVAIDAFAAELALAPFELTIIGVR